MSITQKKRAKIISATYKQWDIAGKRVLDIGCGNGVVTKILARELNLDIWGTDVLDYRKTDLPFKIMPDEMSLPFDDLSFDYVMYNDVLHHVRDPESLIREGKRVGKRLLVFEDRETFLLKIVDIGLNLFYSTQMACPLNFKTREEWCRVFKKAKLGYETGNILYPAWYPFRHEAFILTPEVD
jgi:SAM-dependent methyltransferase